VHYVPPLRLYLFISIVFFITLKFFAANDNNAVSINNSEEMLIQVTSHISELKQQHEVLIKDAPTENQKSQLQVIQQIKQNLDTFKIYQNDLSNPDNKLLKAITSELVSLEFEKLKSNQPLSDENQKRYTKLTEQIVKARKGEKINFLSIVNSSDGNLSLSFLSEEKNRILNKFANELEDKASKAIQNGTGPLLQQTISKLPQLLFVLLPLFAAILKIMYLFSNRFYMEHLTVALHSHSFVFFSILQFEIIDLVQDTFLKTSPILDSMFSVFSTIILIWMPIYLFIMQKRVYKQGYMITFIKYSIIGMAYTVLISITAIIAFVWGLIDL
jgi:hypothetical protein